MSSVAPDLEERIRRLEARGTIADLVHRYALAIRQGRPADCASLFTQDASFAVRETDGPHADHVIERAHPRGHEAVMAFVGQTAQTGMRLVPMIRNLLIDIDGQTATASSIMVTRSWPAGGEVIGEYRDSFREEDGRWLFSQRIFTIFQAPQPH